MINTYKKALLLCMVVILIGAMAACSGNKSESSSDTGSTNTGETKGNTDNSGTGEAKDTKETEESKTPALSTEPVTLKLMYFNTLISKEMVDEFIGNPVKQKYPNITIEYVEPTQGNSLPDLIASGQNIPDIIITDYPNLSSAIDLKYPADMNMSLKDLNVDLSNMETSPLDGIRQLGANEELFGLPLYMDKYMLFYNKDIFDRFGIPYPTAEMSYDDLLGLIKKLTRTEDGVKYLGYRFGDLWTVGYQLGLPVISPETGKPGLQSDGWKRALTFIKDVWDAGVNNGEKGGTHENFFKEKVMGMYPQSLGAAMGLLAEAGPSLNWDMAAMPYSYDSPKVTGPTKPIYMMASSVGKHQREAIAAISYVTTSPDVQLSLSQSGRISVLKDENIRKQFGAKSELLAGKNVGSVFQYPFGNLPYTTAYESAAWAGLDTAIPNVEKGMDVNSALRIADEEANKAVDEYLKGKK